MGNQLSHNIFSYATSELSQDAFLCWLFSYGDLKSKEDYPELHNCAMDLLCKLCPDSQQPIYVKSIHRQEDHIDVLIEAEGINNRALFIIIEDKSGTTEHDEQLERYKKIVIEKYQDQNPEVIGAYYKSGLQGRQDGIIAAGYRAVFRPQILEILNKHPECMKNDIFGSYYRNLYDAQNEAQKYKEYRYDEWEWCQIEAFFDDILHSERFGEEKFCAYDYVPNQDGGFISMWTAGSYIKNEPWQLYFQLEFAPKKAQICIKGWIDGKAEKGKNYISKEGNRFIDQIVHWDKNEYAFRQYEFERPYRLSPHESMTFGKVCIDPNSTYNEIEAKIHYAYHQYECLLKDYSCKID